MEEIKINTNQGLMHQLNDFYEQQTPDRKLIRKQNFEKFVNFLENGVDYDQFLKTAINNSWSEKIVIVNK